MKALAAWWLYLKTRPEMLWRWVLGRLWHDRLAFQYERGREDGLREGLFNAGIYRHCDPEELAALTGCSPYQVVQLLDCLDRKSLNNSEKRDRLLAQIDQERGIA